LKPTPFARQVFSYDIINDLSLETLPELQNQFVRIKPHIPFTPPSEEGTIIFPGFDGGGEWGGQAVDPDGVLYVNSNEMPWILTMINAAAGDTNGERVYLQMCAGCHGKDRSGTQIQGTPVPSVTQAALIEKQLNRAALNEKIQKGTGIMPAFGFLSSKDLNAVINFLLTDNGEPKMISTTKNNKIVYGHTGYNRWKDTHGYPAVKPPWGTLNAIDLNTGEYRWKTTL
jgi:quinoprotein glucose dehydrogenase